jgi:arsenite methyltransferase
MKAKDDEIRKKVRERYAQAAGTGSSCCAPAKAGCCGGGEPEPLGEQASLKVGYSPEELAGVPEEANLGLGCGNPSALADLREGETVLDLGAGAGIDCFLAARKVGPRGRVIGVDMTAEMVERARANVRTSGLANVEFRLGEIEHLPVADGSVDVIISNCVVNLSTDKARVFREALRVLRPGGRMMISDLALLKPLPEAIRKSVELYVSCVAGTLLKDDYLGVIREAGFGAVEVVGEKAFPPELILDNPDARRIAEQHGLSADDLADTVGSVVSLNIRAEKALVHRGNQS